MFGIPICILLYLEKEDFEKYVEINTNYSACYFKLNRMDVSYFVQSFTRKHSSLDISLIPSMLIGSNSQLADWL